MNKIRELKLNNLIPMLMDLTTSWKLYGPVALPINWNALVMTPRSPSVERALNHEDPAFKYLKTNEH